MFIAALFIIAHLGISLKRIEMTSTQWSTTLLLRKNEFEAFAKKWMSLETILLSAINKMQKSYIK